MARKKDKRLFGKKRMEGRMKLFKHLLFVSVLGLSLMSAGMTHAQSSANYRIELDVISGGGGESGSFGYDLLSVLGQSSVTGVTSSDNYVNRGGYLYTLIIRQPVSNISVAPASKDFGLINVGSTSTLHIFEITNTGDASLAIGTVTLSGADMFEFRKRIDTCSGASILPLERCAVETAFSPASGGSKNAGLSVPSDDPDTPVLAIALTGEGTLQSVFNDCPEMHWAEDFINTLFYRGITGGCDGGNYCPDNPVTRAQMAVFIISAMGQTPSTAAFNAYFDDIGDNGFAPFINRMNELGITTGCGPKAYCPNGLLTRQQMAVFIIAGMGEAGSTMAYDAKFDDIANDGFASFINRMNELGITGGCRDRAYCPGDSTNRAMMAVFLVTAF